MGVTVNGVLALVDGDYFIANHVPLEEGENTITVIATGSDGTVVTSEIIVNADTEDDYIFIEADEYSGIAPFETTLKVYGTFTFETEPTITYSGPGDAEFIENPNENEYTVNITVPGLYFFNAEIEHEGVFYIDDIAILVMDEAVLDALLKAKWNDMKAALIDGDIEAALNYLYDTSREKYEAIYNLVGSELQIKAQQMQDIELVFAEGNRAKYRINREHDVNGELITVTYYIYFAKDEDGLWRVEGY